MKYLLKMMKGFFSEDCYLRQGDVTVSSNGLLSMSLRLVWRTTGCLTLLGT